MRKKQVMLLATMITLALQTGSVYAATVVGGVEDFEVPEGSYDKYVEFGTNGDLQGFASIYLGEDEEDNDKKNKEYTFKKGALIDSSNHFISQTPIFYSGAGIYNNTSNNLTINIGNEQEKSTFTILGKNQKNYFESTETHNIYLNNKENDTNNTKIFANNTDIILNQQDNPDIDDDVIEKKSTHIAQMGNT